MRTYNLFRRADRAALVCAVPEEWPVPAFIRGRPWGFGGRLEGTTIGSSRFNHEVAEASVRYNGFYLFQLVDESDLPLGVAQGRVDEESHDARASNEASRRGTPMHPDRGFRADPAQDIGRLSHVA